MPSEEVHCYRNGTVSASPPVIDPEAARDARAAEDYEATAAYEHALQTRALAETVVNASRVGAPGRTPPRTRRRAAAATSPDEPSAEDMLTGAFAQFTETVGVGKLGAAYDPNVPRDGDYTFDERSLPAAAAAVEGEVVVFIVTGEKDQSDFMDLVARTDLHQYASGAAFKTTEAMIGGRAPVLQFARHHARLTYAVAVAGGARRAAVVARFRDPAAQKHLSAAMGGRSLLRDVKIKKEPRVAFEAETAEHVDANVTETRTDAIWNDPLSASASAAMGARENATRGSGGRAEDAENARDVWATFQVPFVAAEDHVVLLRDRLFPAMAEIARAHGETGVVADDVAFVRSKFVFLGAAGHARALARRRRRRRRVRGARRGPRRPRRRAGLLPERHGGGARGRGDQRVHGQPQLDRAFFRRARLDERAEVRQSRRTRRDGERRARAEPPHGGGDVRREHARASVARAPRLRDVRRGRGGPRRGGRGDARAQVGGGCAVHRARAPRRRRRPSRRPRRHLQDAPRGATRGNEDAPASVWANPNVSPPPPPVPAAPDAPPAPSAPFVAPAGAPRKVLVTVAAPTDAVSSPDAKRAAEKAREAKEALARAADTSDEAPFWNGLVNAERDVDIDRLEFNFVAEVVVAGDEAVDVDLLCDAVAADLGARAETSRCALVSTAALGGERRKRKRSPEWEAEAERLRVKRAEARRSRRRERAEARDQAEDELFQRERSAAAEGKEGNLGAENASAKMSPETRLVFSVRETPDRASLDALTAAALNSANDFPTASAVCGGRAVTMEYAHSRAEVTFAVWTTSQQVAATVRAAVAADAFIEEFAFELGGECELRDARVDQLGEPGEENAEAKPGRPAASLGRSSHKSSKKSSKHSSRRRAKAPEASSSELWATVQTPLPDGGDPHAIARELAPALDEALARVRGVGAKKASYVGASYVVMSAVLLPGFPVQLEGAAATLGVPDSARRLGNQGVVSMAQACAAMAVDLGVRAEDAECRFNGTAALGASHSTSHSIGQSVVIIADVGADLARARAAVDRARPERRGAFATTTAVVGGVGGETELEAAAQYARAEAFLAFAVPAADEAARVVARAALSTKAVDAALSEVAGARAVVRAAEKAPSASDVAALDPAPARASSRSVPDTSASHPELDATVFMRDDPVFERDVPGEKGRQGALGGVSRLDETRNEEAKAAAELALRQAKARTAKAQLLALHRMSPRLADLGDAVAPRARGQKVIAGEDDRFKRTTLAVSSVVLAAAALVAADARRRAAATGDAAERVPLVGKNAVAAAV